MGMSETLKAISDPARREILEILKEGKKTAGEIASRFNLTGATVSYHLSTLKKTGLIAETKYKKYIFYELNMKKTKKKNKSKSVVALSIRSTFFMN